MKKRNLVSRLLLLSVCSVCSVALAGCGTILRTQNDEVNQYAPAGGKKIRGPRVGVGPLAVTLFSVDTALTSAVEEPAVVAGSTALSKATLKDLDVAVASQRGATNTLKTVGYRAGAAETDVSTNAAAVVEAGGKAGGQILNKAVTGK